MAWKTNNVVPYCWNIHQPNGYKSYLYLYIFRNLFKPKYSQTSRDGVALLRYSHAWRDIICYKQSMQIDSISYSVFLFLFQLHFFHSSKQIKQNKRILLVANMKRVVILFFKITNFFSTDDEQREKNSGKSNQSMERITQRLSQYIMLCTPVFIFISGSSAQLLWHPDCGLSIWLSLLVLAIFSTLFWVCVKFFTRKRTKHENTWRPPFSYVRKMAADGYWVHKALIVIEPL